MPFPHALCDLWPERTAMAYFHSQSYACHNVFNMKLPSVLAWSAHVIYNQLHQNLRVRVSHFKNLPLPIWYSPLGRDLWVRLFCAWRTTFFGDYECLGRKVGWSDAAKETVPNRYVGKKPRAVQRYWYTGDKQSTDVVILKTGPSSSLRDKMNAIQCQNCFLLRSRTNIWFSIRT